MRQLFTHVVGADMGKYLYLPINHWQNEVSGDFKYDSLQIVVGYDENRGAIVLTIDAGKDETKPNGTFHSWSTTLSAPGTSVPLIEGVSGNSRKMVEAATSEAFRQINTKDGPAWDAVKTFLEVNGMTERPPAR